MIACADIIAGIIGCLSFAEVDVRKAGCSAFILLALLMVVAHARVMSESRPLHEGVATANVVAEVRVDQILQRSFQGTGGSESCGTDYVVDVIQTLKGEHLARRSFSINGPPTSLFEYTVKPGDRLLVLLVPRSKRAAPEGEPADVIRAAPSHEEIKCRETLSTSTLLAGDAGGFPLIGRSRAGGVDAKTLWIAYARSATKMPEKFTAQQVLYDPSCTGEDCERDGRRMIPWEPLKAEIQRWVRDASGR